MALDISLDFTMEDIRKIRDADYEATLGLSPEEIMAYYNERGMAVQREIEARRAAKRAMLADGRIVA